MSHGMPFPPFTPTRADYCAYLALEGAEALYNVTSASCQATASVTKKVGSALGLGEMGNGCLLYLLGCSMRCIEYTQGPDFPQKDLVQPISSDCFEVGTLQLKAGLTKMAPVALAALAHYAYNQS